VDVRVTQQLRFVLFRVVPKRRFENFFLELVIGESRGTLPIHSSIRAGSIHVGGASSSESSWDSSASVGSASW
jgi:hypothetical protein